MLHKKTLAELAQGLAQGEFSSQELTQATLDRIDQYDELLNSFISVNKQAAMAQAKAADKRRAKGEAAPLTGLPIAHKDIFCTKGNKTSCGSKMLDNFISPYDATLISHFNAQNAVMIGKTNMDEFAMGSSNENSYYGSVANPWQKDKVPGGSSGGSAAAVAARLVAGATGTDTGGSIRQPAALCGITGLKPTYGRVSRYGMIAFASSLDQGGPLAQTAQDAAMLLQVMAGFDARDSTSLSEPVPDYLAGINNDISGCRIGLPEEYFDASLRSDVHQLIDDARKALEQLGARFQSVRLPLTKQAVPVYYVVAPAECSSNLSRFDGVRYGYRCDNPRDLQDLYQRSRGEGFGPEVKRRIMIGTYTLSAGYYDAYYLKAQRIRRLIRDEFQAVFEEVDYILGPTTPTPAFAIGEKVTDPVSMYLSDIYTIPANLAGLPAISIPVGMLDNCPIGMQLTGNYLCEAQLLNVAHRYQSVTDWHKRMPAEFAQ